MGGLVGYASSSDDEDMQDEPQPQPTQKVERNKTQQQEDITDEAPPQRPAGRPSPLPPAEKAPTEIPAPTGPMQGPSLPTSAPLMGPSLPPPEPPDDNSNAVSNASAGLPQPPARPSSPYSANAALLRDLTLPPVPDLAIPPSPPGTPPPPVEALTKKFDTFLDLKRTKGTHFNARLAQSSRLTNPAVMDKLLAFVGVETAFPDDGEAAAAGRGDPAAQYATTLSAGVWNPAAFPEWAFRGALKESAEVAARERARGRGEAVEFVKATEGGGESRGGSRAGTPSGLGGKRKMMRLD